MTKAFHYHPDIVAQYPDVVGGIILASGLKNGPTPPALLEAYRTEQEAVIERIGKTPLSEIESLSAWRRAFRAFGVDPTQYRSAAEALLRRLTKKGDIPSINTLVDLGNLVSIRYALPVAVLDMAQVTGAITVHLAAGDERFMPLGVSEAEHPEPGEVVFTDETGMVVARRWCWRQSDESAARESTTDVIITVEAHHSDGHHAIEQAVNDLMTLLADYAGGETTFAILDRDGLSITGG